MNAGKPPSRDWRAQPPVQSLYAREWRGAGRGRTERFSRQFKLRVVGLGLVALVALIVIMLAPAANRVPSVQIVTFGIGAYGGRANPQGNMPVNPYGEQDARAFHVLHELNPAQFPSIRQEDNALNGAQFLSFLQSEADSSTLTSQHLIVFCTLHGLVQPSGQVELFAIDATPDSASNSPATMVPFRDLMARLQESRARRVLLVLDAARLDSNWRMGILNNDIAAQIAADWPPDTTSQSLQSAGDTRKISILLSAGPGQHSWPAENQSALVEFLIEGLSGSADGWEMSQPASDSGPRDRRVSLHELSAFMRHRIEEWTQSRYGVTQTVQLVGNVTDFDLVIATAAATSRVSLSGVKASSLKPSTLKPPSLKAAATKAAKASTKKPDSEKSEGSETEATDNKGVAESKPANESEEAPKSKSDKNAGLRWDVRLTELWKIRDEWRDSGRQGRHTVCRQMPLTWRTFESQLALAAALQRGGMEELSPQAMLQAEAAFKKLQNQSTTLGGLELNRGDSLRHSLQALGFVEELPPSPDVMAAAGKYLSSLSKDPSGSAPTVPPTDGSTSKSVEPEQSAIQAWLRSELRRDSKQETWERLRQIVHQLDQIGRLPPTAESQLLRDILSADGAAARFGTGDALQRIFSLRDRYRKLAVRSPEALPLIRDTVESGLRSLNAAERWLLASNANRSEVRDWLDKSEESATQAESTTRRYVDSIGIWSDLLAELPSTAEWIATRANDDDHRNVDWSRLRELARQWADRERTGNWDAETLADFWPDKPARLVDLERLLLMQFINAQRLKVALLASTEGATGSRFSSDDLLKMANRALTNRNDFRESIHRSLPRLGTSDHPTPTAYREVVRLLEQPWLPNDEHRKLAVLRKLEPRGDPLPDRSVESGSLWQGFWAIATLSLLSSDQESLWKDWDRLAELSQPRSATSNPPSASEQESLRQRRAELGMAIRQQWSSLQGRPQFAKTADSLPKWQLIAATLDPTLLPETDPDVHIREERQRQFAGWLALFSADWRNRAMAMASGDLVGYAALAETTENLARELGGTTTPPPPTVQARFQEAKRPLFDATRLGRLNLSVSPSVDRKSPLQILLSGPHVRLVEGTSRTHLGQTVARPLSASGQLTVDLALDEDVDTVHQLLAVLANADGYPIDFRQIPLYPPFDSTQWRVEFVDAATGTPLEHVPLVNVSGIKVFVPPMAAMSVRANLIRPIKDATSSAKLTIFGSTESGRVPLLEGSILKLETGKERTAILFDLPVPSKDKEVPIPKDKTSAVPLADLARGLVFEITPEDQKPLEYQVRPTFWSAAKFINEPQPLIRDDRFTLDLERRAAAIEDVLLPKKIPVELNLPDSLRNALTDYALGGPIAVSQKLTLSFAMPKNWSDQARDRNWTLALDVAGLPHAYRWRVEPSGNVTAVSGQPPQLDIRLLLPTPEPKERPRLEPVIRKGKESLQLQFLVDATELDRTEEIGDWTLAYTIVREAEAGNEPTPLQHSWRLFSSVQRHVLLDSIQGGVWNLRTSAENYNLEEPESEIRGLLGRFQVQATLTRAAQPSLALATAKLRFAIDDDTPPALEIKGVTSEPRMTDKDLSLRIEAADSESGIQRLVLGFDKNSDKLLQEDEEAIEEQSLIGLENPKVTWPVIISRSKLPTLEKEQETRNLIVQARNGLGIVATRVIPVTLRKPPLSKKMTTGTLVVNLNVLRGAKSTVQISGPEARLEETKTDTLTFTNLPPGQYQINVKVNYAVIGRKDEGEAKVDVKIGETTTAKVPLATTK